MCRHVAYLFWPLLSWWPSIDILGRRELESVMYHKILLMLIKLSSCICFCGGICCRTFYSWAILCPLTFILAVARIPRRGVTLVLKCPEMYHKILLMLIKLSSCICFYGGICYRMFFTCNTLSCDFYSCCCKTSLPRSDIGSEALRSIAVMPNVPIW